MNDYLVTVKGNDGYEASVRIAYADSIEDAIAIACLRLGKLTIERFVEVSAKLLPTNYNKPTTDLVIRSLPKSASTRSIEEIKFLALASDKLPELCDLTHVDWQRVQRELVTTNIPVTDLS